MEIWKDIKGFEGLYRVSNTGKVFSIRRDKNLKGKVDRYGYLAVVLWNGKNNYRTIHRLVAEAFVPKDDGCNVVNHLDCDKLNNNASNLEWTTVQGNTKHAYDNSVAYQERIKVVNKLGIEASKIKIDAYYNGEFIGTFNGKKETAEQLGISEKTVYNRLHGRFSSRSGYTFVEKAVI
jgi:hypothetical protein